MSLELSNPLVIVALCAIVFMMIFGALNWRKLVPNMRTPARANALTQEETDHDTVQQIVTVYHKMGANMSPEEVADLVSRALTHQNPDSTNNRRNSGVALPLSRERQSAEVK